MRRRRVEVPQELVAQGESTFESGITAAEQLLTAGPRSTAIFPSNDETAGALHVARQLDLQVPADRSLIGFDDSPIAMHLWPPLTTARWPIRAMAKAAAFKLVHAEGAANQPALFLSDLVRRASVQPPKRMH